MSTVYVVQQQEIWNGRYYVRKFDLTAAEEYGTLIYLLDPSDNQENPDEVVAKLKEALADFTKDDYLLLIGNPCLIGWASAIAAYKSPTVRMLQWSGRDKKYLPVVANIL